ncbi:MAG: acylphosphatase [Euryarchaeota archaeon]|nr:acylphosphatase [Euryarchaeota archaeon]
MKRAVIIAKGEVQRVGYRDVVEKIARKLKLTGFVENLKPYDVRIVAEGKQGTLDEFITYIKIEKHPITPISVEDLNIRFEVATDEFEYFEIKRGDWQDELGERLDVAGALLYRSVELGAKSVVIGEEMLEKQDEHTQIITEFRDHTLEKQDEHTQIITEFRDQTLEKQDEHTQIITEFRDQTLEKQDEHTQIITEFRDQTLEKQDEHTQIITEFRDQTLQGFVTLDTKYGRISDNMDCIIDEMRNERKETRESMAKLTDAIIELARSRARE